MNKIVIDERVCNKHKMSFQEVLLALAVRMGNHDECIGNMLAREIFVSHDGRYLLTQHWSDVLDEVLCDSSNTDEYTDEHLLELAKKMRECFPEGKMPGTPFYYKCNNSEVVKKLKKFFIQNGKYTDDEIIDATKRYVASFMGDYRYMKLIKYFISKLENEEDEDGNIHKVEHSFLADYLENKEEGKVVGVVNTDGDWLVNSRN